MGEPVSRASLVPKPLSPRALAGRAGVVVAAAALMILPLCRIARSQPAAKPAIKAEPIESQTPA